MSDRTKLFELSTDAGDKGVEMYMDGESGTWRLFLLPGHECVDFTLEGLREFHATLGSVLRDIEADPETFNAEVRAAWGDGD